MSILIKGMETPTRCGECKAFVCYKQWAGDRGDCFCGITKSDCKAGAQNADCPLVPVPPHGRLIDADAVMNSVTDEKGVYVSKFAAVIGEAVDAAPTIIPAEEGET